MKPYIYTIVGFFPFLFSLLALVFSLLAITSPDWASRNQYAENTDALSQVTPIFTLYRSPFQICSIDIAIDNSTAAPPGNTTVEPDPDADDPPPPPPEAFNYTYTQNCIHFLMYGWNRTSCELPSITNSNSVPQSGDARQCQQIHLAGNYHVASVALLTITMLLALLMAGLALTGTIDSSFRRNNHTGDGEVVADHPRRVRHMVTTVQSFPIHQTLFPLAVAGAGTALISQFYAVLGLVQSAPNNADFATSQGNREHHDPWMQGKALSVYLSLSWFWALLAASVGIISWGKTTRRGVFREM